jgi:hypothetical protein
MTLVPPLRFALKVFFFSVVTSHAQVEFWTLSGNSADVNGVADGATVADRLNSNSYNGYVGEMVLMPMDPDFLGSLSPDAPGLIEADSNGNYSGVRGIIGFCIDSETAFKTSATNMNFNSYVPLDYTAANNRYNGINNGSGNGVPFYLSGGLLKAAYLMDKFFEAAHSAGDAEAAALQTAIWEVLYDANASVNTGNGFYYVRNNTGNGTANALSNNIIGITNAWFNAAEADNWGGSSYDPTDRVLFWLDPIDTDNNQSIITLNPFEGPVPVPEVNTAVALTFGIGILLLFRRRS